MGVGPEAFPAVRDHDDALVRIARRAEATGEVSAAPEDVAAMREVYAFHDLQRQSVPQSTYERAMDLAAARIRSAAGDVIVL